MSHAIRMWIAVAIVVLGIFGAFAGAYTLAIFAIHQSQNAWCVSLEILTRHPPVKPAPGHQAEFDNYKFYQSLVDIERRYNCHEGAN